MQNVLRLGKDWKFIVNFNTLKDTKTIKQIEAETKKLLTLGLGVVVTSVSLMVAVPCCLSKSNTEYNRVKPLAPLYKNMEVNQIKTYSFSEILTVSREYEIPNQFAKNGTYYYTGFKSFENTSEITYGKAGWLNSISTTNEDGFQILHNRYLVALGTHFDLELGQYFDIVLENGTVIPCMLGDTKADVDTDNSNILTVNSRCMSEFIVNGSELPERIKISGDISSYSGEWNSKVIKIIVYDNVYTEDTLNEFGK